MYVPDGPPDPAQVAEDEYQDIKDAVAAQDRATTRDKKPKACDSCWLGGPVDPLMGRLDPKSSDVSQEQAASPPMKLVPYEQAV